MISRFGLLSLLLFLAKLIAILIWRGDYLHNTLPTKIALDPESLFAAKVKVPFSKLTQPDLELIPGVGPTLSQRMMQGRKKIATGALEDIHGIGEKKAAILREFIDITR